MYKSKADGRNMTTTAPERKATSRTLAAKTP